MSIFSASRHMKPKPTKAALPKTTQPKPTKTDRPAARTPIPKASSATPRLGAVPDKDAALVEEDEALANLKNTYARAEAEKRQLAERREKAYVTWAEIECEPELTFGPRSASLGNNLLARNGKGAKGKPGKVNLLRPQPITTARSQPNSPGFGALPSPSILSTVNSAQDRAKQQRTPIIHELAVKELSFDQLVAKLGDIDEEDLSSLLKKVADFDDGLQKWALKKLYWKELDVFQYDYKTDEDRQKAIDNAIKVYDRSRIGSTDPLWQKLLPEADRNKGICLSKLQAKVAAIANDAAARRQRTATPGISGADSEKDDSVTGATKGKGGGEAMSRSSSQSQAEKKKTAASKKPATVAAKAAPKTAPKTAPKASATKLATSTKAAPAKPGKAPLSKEFVSSSDDEDEAPLSKAKGTAAQVLTSAAKTAARIVERPKLPERREVAAPKAKPAPAPAAKPIATKRRDEERDMVRAQAPVRPTKAPTKRQREEDEENDSSASSAAPLSKRLKPASKPQPAPAASPAVKQRGSSEATQANRANGSALAKSKNTSPVKSSPLAVSPPTNASEIETDKPATARDHDRGRVRDRENERDTIVSRAGSNRTTSSASSGTTSGSGGDNGSGRASTNGRKRGAEDQAPEGKNKRQRLSEVVLNKAHAFKKFYTRYEALHRELSTLHDPPSERINNLLEMRDRLQEMKREIYREVPVEV